MIAEKNLNCKSIFDKSKKYFGESMNFKFEKNKVLCTFLFCALALVGGGINGFLGTGGGIIFVLLLNGITKNDVKDNFATSLCATIVLSIIGAFSYFKAGNIDFDIILSCSVFCIGGGILGALLTDKIKSSWLNIGFASLIIYSGFSMIFG